MLVSLAATMIELKSAASSEDENYETYISEICQCAAGKP